MRAVLDEVAPHVLLVTETNVPHADNVSYFGDGTNEAQLVYNFALPPLVLHSFAAGNADEAHPLGAVARAAVGPGDLLQFPGLARRHRAEPGARHPERRRRSTPLVRRARWNMAASSPTKSMPDGSQAPYELNINYLDALSNPPPGEAGGTGGAQDASPPTPSCSACKGCPASTSIRCSARAGTGRGAEASGIPRRINREKLERARLEAALAHAGSLRARVFNGQRALLTLRQSHAAFAPTAPQEVLALDPCVFALRRSSPDGMDRMLCLHNVSGGRVRCAVPDAAVEGVNLEPYETRWVPEPGPRG